jgi:uncharacterized protein YxeA
MKKIMTIVLAALFAVSTGAFAAAHMKGDKDAPKAEKDKKGDKKAADKKDEKKK